MMKYTVFDEALSAYVDAHRSDRDDPLLNRLAEETAGLEQSNMQVSADQGTLLSILVAATGARTCVEVGTFTGYSSICIARAMPAGGHLHCFDISDQFTSIARRYWQQAGLSDRITLHLGPAKQTLAEHCPDEIDFAFIDADKVGYDGYYELILPRMRRDGLMLFDNTLAGGRVTDESDQSEYARAIRALNDKLAGDDRVESLLLAFADGVSICRKR